MNPRLFRRPRRLFRVRYLMLALAVVILAPQVEMDQVPQLTALLPTSAASPLQPGSAG